MRQLNWKRRLAYALIKPVIKLLIWVLWKTCRVQVRGEQHAHQVLDSGQPFIPCYWHQQHLFCARYLLMQKRDNFKPGFLISPSVDGEVPAQIVESWGATAIRGSSTRTGARAMRDLYQIMTKQGVSPVNTSDGPTGPIFKFKPGAVMLAQLTQFPILPMAYAAEQAWKLKSWDHFLIPKPFSRIVIAIGEARYVDKSASLELQGNIAAKMESTLMQLMSLANEQLQH